WTGRPDGRSCLTRTHVRFYCRPPTGVESARVPLSDPRRRVLDVPKRCDWGSFEDPLYLAYHDEEWGVPSHEDRHLFEMLVLEGAQAGLSWATILHKREGYRKAFAGFE